MTHSNNIQDVKSCVNNNFALYGVVVFGSRLAEARKRAGLRQVELAVEMGEDYTQSMVSHVESGRRTPQLDRAARAAQALKVSLDYLAGLTDDPTPATERTSTRDANGHQAAPARDDAPARSLLRPPRLRHAHATPRKREAPPVPDAEDVPQALVEGLRQGFSDLRDDLLQQLPERFAAALQSAIAEPAALTPAQRDTGTKLLAFMRPHVVDNDDPVVEQVAASAEYDDDPLVNDVRAAAGFGVPVFEASSEHRVIYHRSIVPGWARRETLVWLWAKGKSMEPTVRHGDLIALDHSYTEPMDGKLFVLQTDDGLVVKRLRGEAYDWQIISDNETYEPRQARKDDRVIGRVAWSGPARI